MIHWWKIHKLTLELTIKNTFLAIQEWGGLAPLKLVNTLHAEDVAIGEVRQAYWR